MQSYSNNNHCNGVSNQNIINIKNVIVHIFDHILELMSNDLKTFFRYLKNMSLVEDPSQGNLGEKFYILKSTKDFINKLLCDIELG